MFSKISLRLRLVFLFVLIFGVTSIWFNTYNFNFTIGVLQKDFDDALFNYAVDVSEGIELGRNEALEIIPINTEGKILPFPLGQALIQIRHNSGLLMARLTPFQEVDFPFDEEFKTFAKGGDAYYRTLENLPIPGAEAHSYRLLSVPLDDNPRPQLALQIAVPMTLLENQINSRLNRLRFGLPIVLLLATLGGIFISGRALAPVKEMTKTANQISAMDLSQRIPIPKNKDEIKDLTLTLNHMLDRIEASFKSQERFIADASHQLLTPLALLKAELELKSKEYSTIEMKEFFNNQLSEVNHLSGIIKDMLFLAQVDSGKEILHREEVFSDEILIDLVPALQRSLKQKNIELKFSLQEPEKRQPIFVDVSLLKHMLTNILENAIKYSPENSILKIENEWQSTESTIRIVDQGPGIPKDVSEQLFDRFKRSRVHETQVKGYGLGLSIAKKIADLHSAKLDFENAESGGTICHVHIPASSLSNLKKS